MRKRQIANDRTIQRENLPLPHVEYPRLYGTFIGYRETPDTPLVFCSCQQSAITACIRIAASKPSESQSLPTANYIVCKSFFPESIYLSFRESGICDAETAISSIAYRECICHRCNKRIPASLYCHEMYAAPFEQTFGWYLNSQMFALGHNPKQFFRRGDPAANDYRAVRATAAEQVRQAFGFPTRGARLTSEIILYHLARSAFTEDIVVHHHRSKFLQGLELDIFVPSVMVAIEYQGEQHFEAMDHWGGEEALARTVERDKKKQRLCKKHGIEILYCQDDSWKYTEDALRDLVLRTAKKRRRKLS